MQFKIFKSAGRALILFICGASFASAETLLVAVASNFTATLQDIALAYHAQTGHTLKTSSASTGKLYAQIQHGAPFDVFMSADEKRADMLVHEGKANAGFARVYALGKLVFISNIEPVGDCVSVLSSADLKWLAIANPDTAPYGSAAQQVMEKLNLWDKLQARLVMGENIAQTLQFVSSTSANAGFVAKSLLSGDAIIKRACEWEVPIDLYAPVRQKMVVLKQSQDKPAVSAFWQFMQSAKAASIIRNHGYDVL